LGKNKILKSSVSKALPKTIMNKEIEFDLENEYKISNEIIIFLDEMILNETATFLDDIVLNEFVVYLKEVVSKRALLFLLLSIMRASMKRSHMLKNAHDSQLFLSVSYYNRTVNVYSMVCRGQREYNCFQMCKSKRGIPVVVFKIAAVNLLS